MISLAEIPVFFSRFFPWPFIWTGGYIACGAVREIYRACGSKRWLTVEGIVSETRILTTDVGEDCVREVFTPIVEFRFTRDGIERTSRKVAMCPNDSGSRKDAEAFLKRYKVGKSVRVYCSPYDSETAILEPGLPWAPVGKLLVGLMLFAAGVAMLWFFRYAGKSEMG